ncbi:segregation/condensation protein A [Egibacter rhizosphaerae]|uniref:Segregation and condensation protein A n=1 Tax=Egibacter rhizosphaerae TaxID=1670831 RepID=A0A411YK82_9ACTN|nr:ScpA family protein [Egibacter rhizosphaerae]QBI21591.1 segregation/condensation protein A [Egibacter rhizosphaerae]
MAASYTVSVGSFEGPFDLLLQLIARHKVDIHEISLAEITDDYLAVLGAMEEVDLEVTTEFLVVAATLLELKAARLLPGEEDPEVEEQALEARDLLYARLLDYRMFKEAAGWLALRLGDHEGLVPRTVGPEPEFAALRPPVQVGVDVEGLAAVGRRVYASQPPGEVDTSHLQPVRLTVREAAGMVVDELVRAGGRVTFRELTAGCRHRVEVVVHFLALLELAARDHVDLEQAERFGTITVHLASGDDGAHRLDDLTPTSADLAPTAPPEADE